MKIKHNKTWFITGASKGMGLALTKYLLQNGYNVAATSRNTKDIVDLFGKNEKFLPLNVDITAEKEVKKAIEKTFNTFGSIDVIVNNAGYGLVGALEELTDLEIRQTIDVNLFGTINVIRASMPYLRKQKYGHVINVSSIAGYNGAALSGSYDAAKFAVIGLSESLHSEVKDFGINVTVAIPGLFRTNFMNDSSLQITANLIEDYKSEAQIKMWQQYSGHQPGDPSKLAMVLKDITEMDEPPLHLLLGSDAFQIATAKMKANLETFEHYKTLSVSTNFD
ncbi:SDR family NAD(P)-dependent oxidoreductase [Chitinophaga sancti]|uniref:SDR family NAD(P)-dependent oxidoreductase n=1 Tax=Chitinophaga sancti TaxID=1004 RepID=UPI002A75BBA3|nr:SDR family NAD(P)-dependent oxidoreductase [Chitinophaga sancti]WPQ63085.1 SDR family NAD(P)-dependent oxidoreductase [Chitinophaga sancti]